MNALVVIVLLTSLLTACGSGGETKYHQKQPATGAIENEDQIQNEPDGDVEGQESEDDDVISGTASAWHILKPDYDWNKKDSTSAPTLAARFPVDQASDVAFVEHGKDFLKARIKLLRSAKHSVRMQVFIFTADEAGQLLAEELKALVRRGIKVQLIVDPVINYKPEDRRILLQLVQSGISVRGYEPGYNDFLKSLGRSDDISDKVLNANFRYHEKLLIIDAETPRSARAMTGGVNASNQYFDFVKEASSHRWVDRDIAVRGPAVVPMAAAFDSTFKEFTDIYHAGGSSSDPFSGLTTLGSLIYNLVRGSFAKDAAIAREAEQTAADSSNYQFAWERARNIRFIQSRPKFKEDFIFPAYLRMIEDAQSEILINNSYFLPEEDLILALRRAVVRGVKVKILTNTKELTDVPKQVEVARTRYKYLLDANSLPGATGKIQIAEWAGDATFENGYGLNHSKYAVFDRSLAVVGSYNLDPRSHNFNSESVVVFDGAPKTIKKFIKEFEQDFAPDHAILVTKAVAAAYRGDDGLTSLFKNTLNNLLAPYL